jgi:hypothetical protein
VPVPGKKRGQAFTAEKILREFENSLKIWE